MTTEVRATSNEERLSTIEATLPHLATKADVAAMESRLLRWIVGLFVVTWVGLLGLTVSSLLN